MGVPELPNFDQALAVSSGQLDANELSECHGALCGLLCRHPSSRADEFVGLLGTLELINEPDPAVLSQFSELHQATVIQLDDDQMRLALWLPDDEEALEDRTNALAHWCTGFLAGLGSGEEFAFDALTEDVSDALADLEHIARAEMTGEGDENEEESALVEIIEYIRMVALMMREELSPAKPQDRVH